MLDRLYKRATGRGRPLVLIACGSFSPITYLHLRLFGKGGDMGLGKRGGRA